MSSKPVGVVLAAGLGTRLRPSTQLCPKPLIPVGGIEPLFFALHKAQAAGLDTVVVNAHYLPELIEQALERWRSLFRGLDIHCVFERPEILGTGGALIHMARRHRDLFKGRGMLVQNGDTLAQFDITKVIELSRATGQSAFAVSCRGEHLAKYSPLWLDEKGDWCGIGRTPPPHDEHPNARPAHYLGVQCLSVDAVAAMIGDEHEFPMRAIDLYNGVYRPLVNHGARFVSIGFFEQAGAGDDEFWFDMTTQEYLLEAQRHVLDSLGRSTLWPTLLRARYPDIQERSPGVWTRTRASLTSVEFHSPAIFVDDTNSLSSRLELGPNAALICEKASGVAVEKAVVCNSVVYGFTREKSSVAGSVRDRVCVV